MKRSYRMLRLFDFWRGSLPAHEALQFENQLTDSETLKRELDESRQLFEALEALADEKSTVDSQFAGDAMRKVRQQTYKMEGSMWARSRRIVNPGLVLLLLCAVALWAQSYRSSNLVLYLVGSGGALLMMFSAVVGILLATFGRFRQSAAFVVLGIALFSLRSMQSTFFSDANLVDGDYVQSSSISGAPIQPSMPVMPKLDSGAAEISEKKLKGAGPIGSLESGDVLAPSKPQELSEGSRDTRYQSGERQAAPVNPYVAQNAVAGGNIAMDSISNMTTTAENREGYGAYDENPRLDPAVAPLSTFSIDVDTGSYTNMRRFISRGQLPPRDSVRLEEYVNYFDYAYESSPTQPFTVNFEVAPSPIDSDYHLVRVGLKARTLPVNSELGWNLVFLIDVSGSMNERNKLPLVKQSLKLLAGNMRAIDRIALITYAGAAGLVLDSTTGAEKGKISAAIDALDAGGSTNGSAGIDLAYQVAQRALIKGSVNRVVLATDGDFNVGTTSFDGLMKIVEERRKSGITLTTLGFGEGNYQEHAMEQLADRGNGNYFYIDTFSEARKVLETGLAANMQIVAKDVKLQMEFNPAVVRQYRLIGFDNRKLNREDFTNDAKDAGEIGSGHTVTALYEIVLQDSPAARKLNQELRYHQEAAPAVSAVPVNPAELGFLKIRYKEPEADVSTPLSFALGRNLVKESNQTSSDFNFAAAVAYFGEILRESQFLGNYSIENVIALAKQSRGEDRSGARAEFIKLAEDANALKVAKHSR